MSAYHVSFFKTLLSALTGTHSSACNSELISVMREALRKP
jgi:hypothetical protein